MAALTLRGLAARKARSVLTGLAVVVGVALISGTFILTDTINRSFDQIFTTAGQGYDVSVTPKQIVSSGNQQPPAIRQSLVAEVRKVGGVDRAVGSIFSDVVLYDGHGKRITAKGGAPSFAASALPRPFEAFEYVDGHPPTSAGQVAVDRAAARDKGLHIGDRLRVAGSGPQHSFRIVGIARFGNADSLAGASVAILTTREAQLVTGKVGKVDSIAVTARKGLSPTALSAHVAAALGPSVTVRTSKQQSDKQAKDIKQSFSFLTTALLVFAGIALFVGAFIIFNVFSITVAQRTREFSMLRTIGASRRQVLRSVVGEALAVGLLASLIGLAAGFGLAPGLSGLFKLFGADLPTGGTVFLARTAIVAIVVGVVVTTVSALSPALRATCVAPMAALREGVELPPGRRSRLRTPFAGLLALGGVALLVLGLFSSAAASAAAGLLGGGAVLIFIGVALLSAKLVRPLAAVIGRPIERARGLTGRLARENTIRNPGRTAGTAAALMIGLALVSFVAIFASGLKSSISTAVDKNFHAPLVVQNVDGFTPYTGAVGPAVARVAGVAGTTSLRTSQAKLAGVKGSRMVVALDPRTAPGVVTLDWQGKTSARTLASLGPRDALVDHQWANDRYVGDTLPITTPTGAHLTLHVVGSFKDRVGLGGDFIVSQATLKRSFDTTKDSITLLTLAPGADVHAVKRAVSRILDAQYPQVEVLTKSEYKQDQANQISKILGLIYVLLSLSVLVSLIGIVTTLALSIHERTRELGLLRAVGTSRRQVKQIVRYEAVITALIGAVLGAILGVFFAIIVSRPLASQGFVLSFPVVTLLVLLVLAAIAGVLAAIYPARRAAELDVLEALAYE